MIRTFQKTDLPQTAELWLNANLEAHSFIPASYWTDHLEEVKEAFLHSELYVWEENGQLLGFIGLSGSYIAGLFVHRHARSRGIGRKLLDAAKEQKNCLHLQVYEKNAAAIKFYQREHFQIQSRQTDPDTQETEYLMVWERQT